MGNKFIEILRKILLPIKPLLEYCSQIEAMLSAYWTGSAHKRLMMIQWGLLPQPENFDHTIDLYFLWRKTRNPQWVERGVFSSICLKGGNVLELCCGDGFNIKNFYSINSKSVVACDFDPHILKVARRKNRGSNITYIQADIRSNIPVGNYENIIWDAAIEHFTTDEISKILKILKIRLSINGVLSGYTIVEINPDQKQLTHHEYEFKNKEDLMNIIAPFFKNICVFESCYPGRHNLYFWASDGPIPFSPHWDKACYSQSLLDIKANNICLDQAL